MSETLLDCAVAGERETKWQRLCDNGRGGGSAAAKTGAHAGIVHLHVCAYGFADVRGSLVTETRAQVLRGQLSCGVLHRDDSVRHD